jgi:hypothetical protein
METSCFLSLYAIRLDEQYEEKATYFSSLLASLPVEIRRTKSKNQSINLKMHIQKLRSSNVELGTLLAAIQSYVNWHKS